MGFSGLMGFVGGMARAGEQVADQTLARMDASAIAKAREEAQIRLEQRTEQAAIAREGRVNSREDFTYKRGLMDEQAKLKDSRDYAIKHEQDQYDLGRSRIPGQIEDGNKIHDGSKAKIEETEKNKSEVNKNNASAEHLRAEAKKTLAEIGAGGAKPLTESEVAARVEVGDKGLKVAYNIGTDPITGQFTGKAEDIKGYITAKSMLERAVRNGESLPSAYVEKLFSGSESEKSTAKAASDERAQRGIDSLNKNKPTLRFKDYTREEFDALPKEEQDKAINQAGQSKEPSTSKDQPVIPKAQLPDGHEKIVNGVTYKWNKSTSQFVESTTPTKPTGLMPQSKLDESPVNKITVSKVPAPLLPNGDKHIVNIPKDGKFYQNVIYRDGADRFEVDADGNRKEVGASVHKNDKPKPEPKQAPIVTSKKIVDQNEFDAIPLPKNLKEANSDDIYFERGADGKNIYYTVMGNKKIKLDIKDSI